MQALAAGLTAGKCLWYALLAAAKAPMSARYSWTNTASARLKPCCCRPAEGRWI